MSDNEFPPRVCLDCSFYDDVNEFQPECVDCESYKRPSGWYY